MANGFSLFASGALGAMYAQIDNSHAYGSFLTPLEEGYYVRRGNRFALRPCVWLFAGTDPQKAGLRKSDKYSDFESRMTAVERLDFASLQAAYRHNSATLQSEARLDQVYVGVLSILKLYPDVTRISQAVLEQFYNLNPAGSPARKIRRMCEALRDVQYGMVSKRNCDNWRDVSWQHSPKKFILINS